MDQATVIPADLQIQPRNVMFARGKSADRWWNGGNPYATAFYNSLSLTFPKGEAFFIESVRNFRDRVPPAQQEQIDAFIKQEAAHSREHNHLNNQVEQAGYDVGAMHADLDSRLALLEDQPPIVGLVTTVALEHFTAIIAHACLQKESHFRGAAPDAARLWKWHAIEEIEHKGVAFDTFLAATKNLSAYKRWKFRSLVMLNISYTFLRGRVRAMRQFLKQDGIDGPVSWLRIFSFLVIYPGLLRQIFPSWLSFFRPKFHPWQHDDRALVAAHEAQLGFPPINKDALIRLT
ncbi:MAG TPA: metal-dependent hydrolase [Steroidobacteraceae bacterium]|jgi:predicted metal-dependent hydrolase|nr:metal-dependent hydrolase [Steroidobacteraceae bacterium]